MEGTNQPSVVTWIVIAAVAIILALWLTSHRRHDERPTPVNPIIVPQPVPSPQPCPGPGPCPRPREE